MGSAQLLGSGFYQALQEGEGIPEPRSVAVHPKKMILVVLRIPSAVPGPVQTSESSQMLTSSPSMNQLAAPSEISLLN